MVYKGANIGSAKPTHDILSEYPHHLVNNKSLNEIYSVAEFCSDSKKIIQEVHSRNKIPLFVGGSMMYFKSLLKGIDNLPERDDSYRKKLAEMKISESDHFLYDLLVSKDPDYAKVIKPNDEKRTIRALEVINKTGKKMSEQINPNLNSLFSNTYDIHQMAIYDKDREKLHKRIEHRLLTMFKEGLIDEVHELVNQYSIKEQHPILSAVNYKQTIDYLEGRINKEEGKRGKGDGREGGEGEGEGEGEEGEGEENLTKARRLLEEKEKEEKGEKWKVLCVLVCILTFHNPSLHQRPFNNSNPNTPYP